MDYGLQLGGYSRRALKRVQGVQTRTVRRIVGAPPSTSGMIVERLLGLPAMWQRGEELQCRYLERIHGMDGGFLVHHALRAVENGAIPGCLLAKLLRSNRLWHGLGEEKVVTAVVMRQWAQDEVQKQVRKLRTVYCMGAQDRRMDVSVRAQVQRPVLSAMLAWRGGWMVSGHRYCVLHPDSRMSRGHAEECSGAVFPFDRDHEMLSLRPGPRPGEAGWDWTMIDRVFNLTRRGCWTMDTHEVRWLVEVLGTVQRLCLGMSEFFFRL